MDLNVESTQVFKRQWKKGLPKGRGHLRAVWSMQCCTSLCRSSSKRRPRARCWWTWARPHSCASYYTWTWTRSRRLSESSSNLRSREPNSNRWSGKPSWNSLITFDETNSIRRRSYPDYNVNYRVVTYYFKFMFKKPHTALDKILIFSPSLRSNLGLSELKWFRWDHTNNL